MDGDIIVIGGGGFGRNPNHRIIEQYIIDQSEPDCPKICFIPTASAEDKSYIVNFYKAFSKLNCEPTHLNLFERTPNLRSVINKQDIIYVGGGNTKSMLAVWREWKLDVLLKKLYDKGKVLSGVSAGAICWFEKGITDSWSSNLNILDCLGFIKGNYCPHYNSEINRKSSVENFITNNEIQSCYASEDGSALHYKNGVLYQSVNFHEGANSYYVSKELDGFVSEKIVKGTKIHKIT